MKVYDVHDASGAPLVFEISNLGIDRARVASIVRTIPGARVIELHRSWWGPDEFCEFEVGGVRFTAWEPFGDNSRYWIGPKPPRLAVETETVRAAFRAYSPRLDRLFALGLLLMMGGALALSVTTPLHWSSRVAIYAMVAGGGLSCVALVRQWFRG